MSKLLFVLALVGCGDSYPSELKNNIERKYPFLRCGLTSVKGVASCTSTLGKSYDVKDTYLCVGPDKFSYDNIVCIKGVIPEVATNAYIIDHY